MKAKTDKYGVPLVLVGEVWYWPEHDQIHFVEMIRYPSPGVKGSKTFRPNPGAVWTASGEPLIGYTWDFKDFEKRCIKLGSFTPEEIS